jgi:hypothetical protein
MPSNARHFQPQKRRRRSDDDDDDDDDDDEADDDDDGAATLAAVVAVRLLPRVLSTRMLVCCLSGQSPFPRAFALLQGPQSTYAYDLTRSQLWTCGVHVCLSTGAGRNARGENGARESASAH